MTLIANVIPFEQPAGGPNFYRFGDDVLYQLNVDNDGDARADKQYQFRFTTTTANPGTFLYNTARSRFDDPDLNVRQTYTVTEVDERVAAACSDEPAGGADQRRGALDARLRGRTSGARPAGLPGGIGTFAGPRDDPFFVDLGSIFDLGGLPPVQPRPPDPVAGRGWRGLRGRPQRAHVRSQIPIDRLVDDDPVIGVWATTYRKTTRIARTTAR